MRSLKILLAAFLVTFIVPAMATAAWWSVMDRPHSWRSADWSTSGILPPAETVEGPAIFVLAARTGGIKGAFSVHSWIVIKSSADAEFDRYDKVGWGLPVRKNAFAADGRWYSNEPWIIASVTGEKAKPLIAKTEKAIADYPFSRHDDYRIWPGPNSNSFVAHVLRNLPEFNATLPPNAVGRDYAPGLANIRIDDDWRDLHATLGGIAGFALGVRSGIEFHLFGLVAGLDFAKPAVKIPAYGRVELSLPDLT